MPKFSLANILRNPHVIFTKDGTVQHGNKPLDVIYNETTESLKYFPNWKNIVEQLQHMKVNDTYTTIDSCVDSTLEMGKCHYLGKNWIGILHGITQKTHAQYATDLFSQHLFQNMLQTCKALVVFSVELKMILDKHINKTKTKIILMDNFIDEIHDLSYEFNFDEYCYNQNILQVTCNNKNFFSIYSLQTPTSIVKCNMIFDEMQKLHFETEIHNTHNKCFLCNDPHSTNKYLEGLLKCIKTVDLIENYDQNPFLKHSVIFFDTINICTEDYLIYCIQHNIPVLINRSSTAEKLLGTDYALMYDNLAEAGELVSNLSNVKKAHSQIMNLNKTPLTVAYFINQMEALLN